MRKNEGNMVMSARKAMVASLVMAVVNLSLADFAKVQGGTAVYSEDFSTDPGWTTNAPGLFHWNPGPETYAATQVNVNYGGYYAYYDVGHDGSSFWLKWDIIVHSTDYASALTFGIFEDAYIESGTHAYLHFTDCDQGRHLGLNYNDETGGGRATTPGDQFALDTWYTVVMAYDDAAGTLMQR